MNNIGRALANTSSYHNLHKLMENSQVSLSPFGSRVLSVPDYKGTVLLEKVAKKWVSLDQERSYPPSQCKAAVQVQVKLLDHYRISDTLIDNSHNVFVIFSRVMKSCVSFFLEWVGIPADLWLKPSARITLESAPDKIHMNVLEQAENSNQTDKFGK